MAKNIVTLSEWWPIIKKRFDTRNDLLTTATYNRTIIPDIGYFFGPREKRIFYHICEATIIGTIENRDDIAYCRGCEKDLKTPYKTVIFAIKLATFGK